MMTSAGTSSLSGRRSRSTSFLRAINSGLWFRRVHNSADLEPGGFLPQLGATARVLRDECPPGLKVGAQVTLDGEPYRVEGISYRAGLPISTLDLKHL